MESAAAPDSPAMPDIAGSSESATVTAPTEPAGRRLYSIQVGSFLDSASANQLVERLRSEGWPVWSAVVQVGGRSFHRVRVGALRTVDEARLLGTLVTRRYGWPIWLAPVTPGDAPPANAIEATRRALNQG
jgi:cell division septation protein DedD